MSALHTPGPWKLNGRIVMNDAKSGFCIAEVFGSFGKPMEKNGMLIAAAPDLLDALKACDEAMSYMSEYDIPLTLPGQVKAAIAKATKGTT